MKIRADENVSPKIVQVLRLISLGPGWELTGVREVHPPRTADQTWVPRFAAEGGRGIITADVNMLKRPHLMAAILASGVFGLLLPSAWAQARRHVQAASIIHFWPEIEATFSVAQPGEFWRMPAALYFGSLERIVVNYAAAAHAIRRHRDATDP